MWSEADRRFWFYDLYGHSYRGDLGRSPARTRARLQEALERWRAASGDVVYVGQAGWYHPEQSRWELIYGRKLD
jgi:hypothetical protein